MRLLVLLALILLAGCDVKIRRGDDYEQPPADLIAKGRNPAFREVVIEDPVLRDKLCRAAGVDANDEFNAHRLVACVDLDGKIVYLPPNPSESLLRHERGHEWGYEHRGGKGFYPPQNVFAQGQGSYDWSKVFQPRTETGATNIFRGR